jgi:hypothetical protein
VLRRYARWMLALNVEMSLAVGAVAEGGTVRVGMPQDFAHADCRLCLLAMPSSAQQRPTLK